MLPPYIAHVGTASRSLLPCFYGLFRIDDAAGRPLGYYLLSENFFASAQALHT